MVGQIEGHIIDGMDVLSVLKAGKEAAEFCRSGKGPIILEMKTYRYRGHSMSDPAKYRTREEVKKIKEDKDPIDQLRKKLISKKTSEEKLKSIDDEIKKQISDAATKAMEDDLPDISELYTDIYK